MPRKAKPFYRKSDGWWYFNVTVGGQRRQVRLAEGRDAKDAAEEKFHELQAKRLKAKASGRELRMSHTLTDGLRVAEVVDRFLGHSEKNSAKKTHRWYGDFLNDWLDHVDAELSAVKLRVHHVTAWIDDRPDWSNSTKAGAVCSVRRAFRWATEQGLIETYPLFGLRAPAKETRETVISPERYAAILANIKDQPFRDLLVFLWETGARPQEASRALISHYQTARSMVVFPRSQAKGKRAPRAIFLTPVAREVVERCIGKRKEGPIFRNMRKGRWTADSIKCRFQRLSHLPDCDKLCAYHFRHSYGTHALEAGVDPITASVLMGHADASTLARTYQHLAKNPANLLEAAAKVR